jgi:DNA-binding transcriptional regulator YiaG
MDPAELKFARNALGLSAEGFARLVRVESGRTVRRWESGERDIPGPVTVIVDLLLASEEARVLLRQTLRGKNSPVREPVRTVGSKK